MKKSSYFTINGQENGVRLESRVLEERIQRAVADGYRRLEIQAKGQHGLGGRLWSSGDDPVNVRIKGQPGQRLGSMGYPNTSIEIFGPASDDVGWLNAGAEIIVHGNAGNGVANAMAQGKIYIKGNIGARGMTMTKQNPRFAPPELWVLGSVGDYFGEFMAGGIAVVCGIEAQNPDNVLGYRPLVGMVGGKVFFHGPHGGFSQTDAKQLPIGEADFEWLQENLKKYLKAIGRETLLGQLSQPDQWQLLTARPPGEKKARGLRTISEFRRDVWDGELGRGGLIGDLTDLDRGPIPVVTSGEMRRYVPVWENRKYSAPCESTCPTGIPVQERWRLIREGRMDEAVDLALSFTPFPATVCGYLCPNPCMRACTRQSAFITPVDVKQLGKASIDAAIPQLPPLSGKKIAVIGGGPAGLSIAWQLRMAGHEAVVYDTTEELGGKIVSVIPNTRIPEDVVVSEVERLRQVLPHLHLKQALTRDDIDRMKVDFEFVVIAVGAQKPRTLPVPGNEHLITALDFLAGAKKGNILPGERVVVIGAGNVGCDVATEAHRLGAKEITLIDIQEPAAFGQEKADAEKAGAKFRWPVFTQEISAEGVKLTSGELLPADTVVVSIGDAPDTGFLPDTVAVEHGFVGVNEYGQTSDPKIFAVGDVVKLGLLTDAIGAGRMAAMAMADTLAGKQPRVDIRPMIDKSRITLEYFDPRILEYQDVDHCGSQCSSCGTCRDCGICVAACPQVAISRHEIDVTEYEYIVDPDRCIGCGFCAGACPCGIWDLVENEPMG
jgi:NADPH-dependent glutamate synthase beta subunit-like oxidoreductase/glutamate synthase domain-containing protein 3/NAD-dependent dihydropyrimidine dehydrogenase PreA subunit